MAEPLSREEINRHVEILNGSQESDRVAVSAIALAGSEDPEAIIALTRCLRRPGFLDRLDNTAEPSSEITNLTPVFRALAEHPTEATGRLCESVYADEDFRAIPARINLLLSALAAVRPATAQAADVFRATSAPVERGC